MTKKDAFVLYPTAKEPVEALPELPPRAAAQPDEDIDMKPLPEPPEKAREAKIRARLLRNTKATLKDILSGFDENPARCLRLLSEYATSQRDFLANLEVKEEIRGFGGFPLPGGAGPDAVLRELLDLAKGAVQASLEIQQKRFAPKAIATAPEEEDDEISLDDGIDEPVIVLDVKEAR